MKLASGLLGRESLLITLPFASGLIKLAASFVQTHSPGSSVYVQVSSQYRISLLSRSALLLVLFGLTRVLQQKE